MRDGQESEPPSCLRPSVFMIGQDSRGNWVVRDQPGVRGGLFVGHAQALRYVRTEARNDPATVVMVGGALELDTSGVRRPALHRQRAEERLECRAV